MGMGGKQIPRRARAGTSRSRKRLDVLGWVDGRNVNIDYRWGAGNVERMQLFAKELVRLNPDVIVFLYHSGPPQRWQADKPVQFR